MNKKDLKPGYVVELRCGGIFICIPYENGITLNNSEGIFLSVNDLNNDLTCKNFPDLDVIRVWGLCKTQANAGVISSRNRPLLWERIEEPTEEDVLKTAISTYGNEAQLCVAMEECAELIQAISKYKRYGSKAQEQVAEEIADVLIVVDEVKLICGIKDE